jgi:oxygen-independent coproporphyrinogen-3 oxidase
VEGFNYGLFEGRTGLPREAIRRRIDKARHDGMLREDGDLVVPTALGGRFLNDLIALFLPG